MIKRFYVHNFRCLENFELPIGGRPSTLLIGKNGAGKSAIGRALRILQRIGRGHNSSDALLKKEEFCRGRTDVPVRIQIEVELEGNLYAYDIAFQFLLASSEVGLFEEKLTVDGKPLYARVGSQVSLARGDSQIRIDGQLVALPILQEESPQDPMFIFKEWLSHILILQPAPSLITGDSERATLEPRVGVTNLGAWLSGLLANAPSAYTDVDAYLKEVMPDFKDIKNPLIGKDARSMSVQFFNDKGSISLPFQYLSDGEKCFTICALVLAANNVYSPVFCFWDEPDNYLALSEVGHFVLALRKAFQSAGQFIATSHNPEAIRRFSNESTFLLYRKSHLEPTIVRPLKELKVNGDLVDALIRDDVEP